MKKILVVMLAVAALVVGAAVFVKMQYPDSEAAALVDKCWGRARSEFNDAWERVNAQDNYSAALEKSIAEAEDSDEEGETSAPATAEAAARQLAAAAAKAKTIVSGPAAFTKENHYAGPVVKSQDSLRGKVVLVYTWSINDKASAMRLPRVQQIWNAFSHKPFVVIASHRGGRHPKVQKVIEAAKLTIPCYEGAGLSSEPRSAANSGCFYVVDANGRLVHAGKSDRHALEAVVNAFGSVR